MEITEVLGADRSEIVSPAFTEAELQLGLAVNRDLTSMSTGLDSRADTSYVRPGVTIVVSIERDAEFRTLLTDIKAYTESLNDPMQKVQDAASLLVIFTPMNINAVQTRRYGYLSSFLSNPDEIECIDRAIALEAVLKLTGTVDRAAIITSSDSEPVSGAHLSNHADVLFTFRGSSTEYVVITTGDKAGAVMTRDTYENDYFARRESEGLGVRVVTGTELPYFQMVT